MPWNPALHTHTPVLAVIEPRGLLARSVSSHRAEIPETLAERIDRTVYDAAARPVGRWDARLWAAAEQVSDAPRNLSYLYSLSGRPLFCDSADAGWSASLEGEAGQAMYRWNARGHSQRVEHDGWLRPVALFESDGSHEGCVERFVYGAVDAAARNQCGRMIRHDDPAGVALNSGFDISGALVEQTRRFLNAVNSSDWPQSIDERDALLETGLGLTTGWRYNPLGELLEQIDCQLNVRRFSQTVSGVLKSAALQLKDQSEQVLVDGIRYNAQGQIESEIAGNGVVTTALYRPQDGRLIRLKAQRDDGHVLQDLHYEYDPVGNVTRLEDSAQSTRFFGNQQVDPVSTYRYDTLYQLIEATGRETASINHGPALPGFQSPVDPSQLTNYTQTFNYDAGRNLLKLSHVGAQNHSLSMVSARQSNRSLPVLNDVPPSEADIAAAFDASGNLRALQPGQTLTWDRRNQLQEVRPVIRESGQDDSESYVYDGKGQRVRKVTTKLAASVTHTAEVRYLPGVEIRTNTATGETLHVVTVQAGRNSVRVLHWQQGKPEGIGNDQSRYGLSDHLNSCALELDQQAQTISQESYYPFGGTSWWAGRSEVEARYKTVRYSGKERDAAGLYYYGLRYYAPWLMRWINPDPVGERGGINLFCFVNNSPLRFRDLKGAAPFDVKTEQEMYSLDNNRMLQEARGLAEFSPVQRAKFKEAAKTAVRLLDKTRAELGKESPRKGVDKVFKAIFGDVNQEHQMQIVADLDKAFEMQRDFLHSLTGESAWKIGLFRTDGNVVGVARNASDYEPERTMSLSASLVEEGHTLEVASTLIHEASHITQNTVDSFYNALGALKAGSDSTDVAQWSRAIRGVVRSIRETGPDEESSATVVARYTEVMDSILRRPTSKAIRTDEFVNEPFIRSAVLLANADTFSSFVMGTKLPAKMMSRGAGKPAKAMGSLRSKETF
jgi:insecticidal toxin complex protein TccC